MARNHDTLTMAAIMRRVTPMIPAIPEIPTIPAIPQPATAAPPSEATAGARGSSMLYARADHTHPRVSSTTNVTLDGAGVGQALFTRTFDRQPGLNLTETDADPASMPLAIRGTTWVKDANGLFIGVNIQGRRSRALPILDPLTGLLNLLGVNTLFGLLSGYSLWSAPAAGAKVSVIAIARSDPAP